MEYPKFKVCCCCFTFNQAKYITDTMNGFTMQQTTFPFVCTIVDDASTDGEQEVIRKYVEENFDLSEDSVAFQKETEYAHITYVQHKTNKNCFFVVLCLKENHYSQRKPKKQYLNEWRDSCEYEALCEGDDYWIDPLKLQKQVDALDSDDSATFSYSSFKTVDMNGKEELRPFFERCIQRSHSGNVLYDLFTQNFIMTLTIMYRRSMVLGYSYFDNYQGPKCDYYLFMLLSTKGNAIYIDDEMGCYRNNPHGLINTDKQQIDDIIWQIYKYFALGVVGRQLARRLSFSVIAKLYCQFFYRAVNKYIRRQDKAFIFLLIKYIFSFGR